MISTEATPSSRSSAGEISSSAMDWSVARSVPRSAMTDTGMESTSMDMTVGSDASSGSWLLTWDTLSRRSTIAESRSVSLVNWMMTMDRFSAEVDCSVSRPDRPATALSSFFVTCCSISSGPAPA